MADPEFPPFPLSPRKPLDFLRGAGVPPFAGRRRSFTERQLLAGALGVSPSEVAEYEPTEPGTTEMGPLTPIASLQPGVNVVYDEQNRPMAAVPEPTKDPVAWLGRRMQPLSAITPERVVPAVGRVAKKVGTEFKEDPLGTTQEVVGQGLTGLAEGGEFLLRAPDLLVTRGSDALGIPHRELLPGYDKAFSGGSLLDAMGKSVSTVQGLAPEPESTAGSIARLAGGFVDPISPAVGLMGVAGALRKVEAIERGVQATRQALRRAEGLQGALDLVRNEAGAVGGRMAKGARRVPALNRDGPNLAVDFAVHSADAAGPATRVTVNETGTAAMRAHPDAIILNRSITPEQTEQAIATIKDDLVRSMTDGLHGERGTQKLVDDFTTNAKESGASWFNDVPKMDEGLAAERPELRSKRLKGESAEEFAEATADGAKYAESRRGFFKIALAAMSGGANPPSNLQSSLDLWNRFWAKGDFGDVISNSAGKEVFERFRATGDGVQGHRYAASTHDAALGRLREELQRYLDKGLNRDEAIKGLVKDLLKNSDYKTRTGGIYDILGPKTGSYWLNLMGKLDPVTVDVWIIRQARRALKYVREVKRKQGWVLDDAPLATEYGVISEAYTRLAKELSERTGLKITPAQVQSRAWYMEKRRWADGGVPDSGTSDYVDALPDLHHKEVFEGGHLELPSITRVGKSGDVEPLPKAKLRDALKRREDVIDKDMLRSTLMDRANAPRNAEVRRKVLGHGGRARTTEEAKKVVMASERGFVGGDGGGALRMLGGMGGAGAGGLAGGAAGASIEASTPEERQRNILLGALAGAGLGAAGGWKVLGALEGSMPRVAGHFGPHQADDVVRSLVEGVPSRPDGFTFNLQQNRFLSEGGHMVGGLGRSLVVDAPTQEAIEEAIRVNRRLFDENPDLRLGGWKREDGNWVLEPAEEIEDAGLAQRAMEQRNQHSAYHLSRGASVENPSFDPTRANDATHTGREGNTDVSRIASEYRRDAGIRGGELSPIDKVDEGVARRMAEHYERTPDQSSDPAVRAAYRAFVDETKAQYERIVKAGYRIEFVDEDPYRNSAEMMEDLRTNKRLKVFRSKEGDHPLLTPEENNLFRAVHDFFGHAKHGNQFGPKGEELAFRDHSPMYSPKARRAMATETRGQNSWVNYGPRAAENRVGPGSVYAEQKAFLWPEEFVGEYTPRGGLRGRRGALGKEDLRPRDYLNTPAYSVSPEGRRVLEERVLETAEESRGIPKRTESWDEVRAAADALDPATLPKRLHEAVNYRAASLATRRQITTLAEREAGLLARWKEASGESRRLIEEELALVQQHLDDAIIRVSRGESEAGRNLNAAKIHAALVDDPASWIIRGERELGRPLSPDERTTITQMANNLQQGNDYALAQRFTAAKAAGNNEAVEALRQTIKGRMRRRGQLYDPNQSDLFGFVPEARQPSPVPPPKPKPAPKPVVSDAFLAKIDERAAAARARLAERQNKRYAGGISTEDLQDYVDIGVAYLAHGLRDFTDWVQQFRRDFGASVPDEAEREIYQRASYLLRQEENAEAIKATEALEPNKVRSAPRPQKETVAPEDLGIERFDDNPLGDASGMAPESPEMALESTNEGRVSLSSPQKEIARLEAEEVKAQRAWLREQMGMETNPLRERPVRPAEEPLGLEQATEADVPTVGQAEEVLPERGHAEFTQGGREGKYRTPEPIKHVKSEEEQVADWVAKQRDLGHKGETVEEIMQYIASLHRSGVATQLATIRKGGLLTNLASRGFDFVSSITNQGLEWVNSIGRVAADRALDLRYRDAAHKLGLGSLTTSTIITPRRVGAWLKAAPEGMREGAEVIKLPTLWEKGFSKWWEEIRKADVTEENIRRFDVPHLINIDLAHRAGLPASAANLIDGALDGYQKFVFRFAALPDRIAHRAARGEALMDVLQARVKREGLRGQEASTRLQELLRDPPQVDVDDALLIANQITFRNHSWLSEISRKLKGAPARAMQTLGAGKRAEDVAHAVADWFLPFSTTGANIGDKLLDYSGIGAAVRGVMLKPEFDRALAAALKAKHEGDAVKAAEELHQALKIKRRIVESAGRGVTGTGLMAIGAWLYKNGMLSPSYPGQSGDTSDKTRADIGNVPWGAVRVGDRWTPITRLAPLGASLIMGANIAKGAEEATTPSGVVGAFGTAAAQTAKDLPLATGMANLDKAINDNQNIDRVVANEARSAIPAGVAALARGERGVRTAPRGIVEGLKANTPGLSDEVPAKLSQLGDSLPLAAGSSLGFFGTTSLDEDPVVAEIMRVKADIPALARKTGESTEDYNERVRTRGALLKVGLAELLSLPVYQNASDSLKAEALHDAVERVSSLVRNKNFPMATQAQREAAARAIVRRKVAGLSD